MRERSALWGCFPQRGLIWGGEVRYKIYSARWHVPRDSRDRDRRFNNEVTEVTESVLFQIWSSHRQYITEA